MVYDGNQLEPFASRTPEEIMTRYADALATGGSYDDADMSSYYAEEPSLVSPYAAGRLSGDTHAAMTAMTDFYRWLVGVQTLTSASTHSDALQAGALVRCWDFNHTVRAAYKPSDMPQALWDFGAGAVHNILAAGFTPRGAIAGWLNEGYRLEERRWDTIGHRNCLLRADVSGLQFGYVSNLGEQRYDIDNQVAIGVMTEHNNSAVLPFAAFPAVGWMPWNELSVRYSAWSVEMNGSYLSIRSKDAVRVTVTNLQTGDSYDCTEANGKLKTGTTLAFAQPAPTNGTVYGNRYSDADRFRVEIDGLRDVSTGGNARIVYEVYLFDLRGGEQTSVAACTVNGWNQLYLTKSMTNGETLEQLAALLPRELNVTLGNKATLTVPTEGPWQFDTAGKRFVNSIDPARIPSYITDPEGLLGAFTLPWAERNDNGSLVTEPQRPTVGASGAFVLRRDVEATNLDWFYQVTETDGTYAGTLRCQNGSPGFQISYYYGDRWTVERWDESWSGKWFALYSASGARRGTAYVVEGPSVELKPEIKKLTVSADGKTAAVTLSQAVEPGCRLLIAAYRANGHMLDAVSVTVGEERSYTWSVNYGGATRFSAYLTDDNLNPMLAPKTVTLE